MKEEPFWKKGKSRRKERHDLDSIIPEEESILRLVVSPGMVVCMSDESVNEVTDGTSRR